ncbi:MAG: MinD/ParA family protein [Lachnospiraceae bacterium]|nr:MinD/ParA family protein [Lachnospiraceae bacterium]
MDQAEKLRNEVKLRRKTTRTKVLTVTSGKGGVGKSNLAVNLAVWFTKLGKKVIIFDADFGLANVEVMFGTVPKNDLSDMIYKGMDIRDIITNGPMDIGFISGGSGIIALNNLTAAQVDLVVDDLESLNDLCDILIVDTGAGISDNVLKFVLASPDVLLVTTPEPSSLTDSYSLVKAMVRNEKFDSENVQIRMIANKVQSEAEARQVFEKIYSVTNKFLDERISYAGMVCLDQSLEKAVRKQKIVSIENPTSKSAKCFYDIASYLLGEKQKDDSGLHKFFRFLTHNQ